ncbi:MAG: hypothetical protein Q9161_007202 [Pseudevernia consocians]
MCGLNPVLPMDKLLQAPGLTPIAQYMNDDMVDIYVGTSRRKFRLHRDLLCERSEFFEAALEGHFKEAEAQELTLPEDSVESFERLVCWLYGAPLMSMPLEPSEDDFSANVNLFILAKKLCLEHLQNETMDRVLKYYRLVLLEVDVCILCENTSAGDPLRRLSIQCAAWKAVFNAVHNKDTAFESGSEYLLEGGGEIAIDFASWLARFYAISKGSRGKLASIDPRRKSNCFYHVHNSTLACSDPSK